MNCPKCGWADLACKCTANNTQPDAGEEPPVDWPSNVLTDTANEEDVIAQLRAEVTGLREEVADLKSYIKGCADLIPDTQTGVLAGRILNLQKRIAEG